MKSPGLASLLFFLLAGLPVSFAGRSSSEAATYKFTLPFPASVLAALQEAGKNGGELEKAARYFQKKGDAEELKAVYFLISSMSLHFAEDFYWADSSGKRIAFSEQDYPDYSQAASALQAIGRRLGPLHAVPFTASDLETMTSQALIENVEEATAAWRNAPAPRASFDDFCEFILPYRVTSEPFQPWRKSYRRRFGPWRDSTSRLTAENQLRAMAAGYGSWFLNTWNIEQRKEPLPRLGAQQLLSRKKGTCDDVADLAAFTLRAFGRVATVEYIPFWATSTGQHIFNSTLDEGGQRLPFDASTANVRLGKFDREPSKVLRLTYSAGPGTLAARVKGEDIPAGFLRMKNYRDVTAEYYPTIDLRCAVGKVKSVSTVSKDASGNIAYACVFNGLAWHPTWWGSVTKSNGSTGSAASGDSLTATFTGLCRGAVFLPARYAGGKVVPAGYPVAVGHNHTQVLAADTTNKRDITLYEQEKYLLFRPDKKYTLHYWDGAWRALGTELAKQGARELRFSAVPSNALLLLVPEYSQGKERPFIVTQEGKRVWF